MITKKSKSFFTYAAAGCAVLAALGGFTLPVIAQPIAVPNGSMESQSGVGQPFGVNVLVDSWEKPSRPAYFESVETNYSIFWIQTAGAFVDSNTPYANLHGSQAGYLLSFPQVALFQDYETRDWNDGEPTHEFNAIYEAGKAYQLTVGVFGKNMTEGSMFNLSLYYRDAQSSMVPVSSTTITYQAANFPSAQPRNLVDYQVNVPTVLANDAWAGKHIGIKLESTFGYGDGYWDFDNVRLAAIPEPGSLVLLASGLGCLVWWSRTRRRA